MATFIEDSQLSLLSLAIHIQLSNASTLGQPSSEAVARLLIEPAEAAHTGGREKKHTPPLLGLVYTFALIFLYNSTHSKDAIPVQDKT